MANLDDRKIDGKDMRSATTKPILYKDEANRIAKNIRNRGFNARVIPINCYVVYYTEGKNMDVKIQTIHHYYDKNSITNFDKSEVKDFIINPKRYKMADNLPKWIALREMEKRNTTFDLAYIIAKNKIKRWYNSKESYIIDFIDDKTYKVRKR